MYTLVIGNKNYSSWSMRPWLLMQHFGIPFEERFIPLYQDGHREKIAPLSPSGRVPCLIDGETVIWDSLAICEYLADHHAGLWPADAAARGVARSVCAEMHSGFTALRSTFGMNIRRRSPRPIPTPEVAADIDRIVALWTDCRTRFGQGQGGPWLFGKFSVADAFYAPVCFRFQTYGVVPTGIAGDYQHAMLQTPALQTLAQQAEKETEAIAMFDAL
jgi:glutathione S-transferase